MPQRIVQVDAFTGERFTGNPAAVCVLEGPADEDWMSDVAREMNLSETAFLHASENGGWALRWFTPRVEVDLCGHATLAAAHVLWEDGLVPADAEARFHTRSGILVASRRDDWIELDFPSEPPEAIDPPLLLLDALDMRPLYVGRNRFDHLVRIGNEDAVRSLDPDLRLLRDLDTRGVIVTAAATPPTAADFVSRYFAPAVGIDEDPVTGSAHCCLGPYWAAELGSEELVGYQASARGGLVRVRVAGARVELGGQAVTVLRGELC
ncbi:MAG: PhzF family phenazine biosynthesis protein [Longimicrobiales bacterium]